MSDTPAARPHRAPPSTFRPKKPRPGEEVGGGFLVMRRGGSGRVRAAMWPFEHPTQAGAEEEAARLAGAQPGEVFTVWAQVSGAIAVAADEAMAGPEDRPARPDDALIAAGMA